VLYEYHNGNLSPSTWYRNTKESLPVQWILGGLRPGRTAWYDFQQRFDPIIEQLNAALLAHHTPSHDHSAAIDGTFVAAHASRHNACSPIICVKKSLKFFYIKHIGEFFAARVRPPNGLLSRLVLFYCLHDGSKTLAFRRHLYGRIITQKL